MKIRWLIFCMLVSSIAFAIDKSVFDLNLDNSLQKSTSQNASNTYNSQILKTEISEISLISGGYFTIGTHNGVSETSNLDNLCNITFGHPYALTSYPVIMIDGTWYKLDEFYADFASLSPGISGDSVSVYSPPADPISTSFTMTQLDNGKKIEFSLVLKNLDSDDHVMGLGVVIDPDLGHWGDGCVLVNNNAVLTGTTLINDPPTVIEVWERSPHELVSGPAVAKGMGFNVNFQNSKPSQLIIANWPELSEKNDLNNIKNEPAIPLFDLTMAVLWNEGRMSSGESKIQKFTLEILEPVFSSDIFMRWDMPGFFSMVNNILFPGSFLSTIQVDNTSSNLQSNVTLNAKMPPEFTGEIPHSVFHIYAQDSDYLQFKLTANENYEDKVVPVEISCLKNNIEIDRLKRNIFLPATPVSDTGLVVTIDSLNTDEFPAISLVFDSEIEVSGQKLLNLKKNNIFLYENDICITDIHLEKFSGGGSDLADVVFVLDVSGSMSNEINQVRDNIGEFGDSLQTRGYDYMIGIVTFSTTVDNVWDFTNNLDQIRSNLSSISLWGGTEDSPAALYKGSELSFRSGSKRTIIWITDEPYPEYTYTKQEVVNRMLEMGITVHGVGLLELQTDWFNPIVLPTGGNFYDINGNFRDILLDVARMESQYRYLLTFSSALQNPTQVSLLLKVHYAGLGGSAEITFKPLSTDFCIKNLACFPNPFNPEIKIAVDNISSKDELAIFNLLGQCVKHYNLRRSGHHEILWRAQDDAGHPLSTGFYLVRLSTLDSKGNSHYETQKILYLK